MGAAARPPDWGRCHARYRVPSAESDPGSERLGALLYAAREQGLLLMPSGKERHIIRLLAPLTCEHERLEDGFDIFARCLAELA